MAVDQLQQIQSRRGLVDPAGRTERTESAREAIAEGRRRTLLFAGVLGAVILVAALGSGCTRARMNRRMTRRSMGISTESPPASMAT